MRLQRLLSPYSALFAACYLFPAFGPAACWWKYDDAAWQSHFVPIAATDLSSPHPEAKSYVDPDTHLLSVLLAFRPSPLETGNARNQLRLFSRFFEIKTLKEWVVVTPAAHFEETTAFLKHQIPAELPEVSGSLFRILRDGQCVPEFDADSPQFRCPSHLSTYLTSSMHHCSNAVGFSPLLIPMGGPGHVFSNAYI